MRVLFSNPPWWTYKNSRRDNKKMLAKGVRAGSRWPLRLFVNQNMIIEIMTIILHFHIF